MASKLTPYRGKRFVFMLLHFQRVLLTCHDTQGAALGYEQVGPSGRSLSEKVYLYIIPEKNREIRVIRA